MELQHFLLTRFNLLLWQKDKESRKVRTMKWLEHRFLMFEKYCLPSVKNQTCLEFEWIVLFDSKTPERFKEKIEYYQNKCPQFVPVFVEPERGRFFAEIFRGEIIKRLKAKRVITTYLDNDDALNLRFVEDLQQRALHASDGIFFYYDKGYQYYTDYRYLLQIHYPRNHFVSVIERGDALATKGVFGYGSHYSIYKKRGAVIDHIKTVPMWCEVVHEKNMLNDANFLFGTKMIGDCDVLRREFAIEEPVKAGIGIYVIRFIPRYLKTFVRRTKNKLFGRKW